MTPFRWISLNVSEQGLLSWLHLDGFCWHFHKRACFVEMIEMRGYNPILTSKLFILFIILTPFRWISLKCVEQSLYCWDNLNEGSHLIFNSKLYVLFNILTPCRWFFFLKLSEHGLFCWNDWNEVSQPCTKFKTVCFVQYFETCRISVSCAISPTAFLLFLELPVDWPLLVSHEATSSNGQSVLALACSWFHHITHTCIPSQDQV